MPQKLASDLVHTNEEFTKLKSGVVDDKTPRENPDHQSPGRSGLARPDMETWTVEELRKAARTLNLSAADSYDREQLIDALESATPRR